MLISLHHFDGEDVVNFDVMGREPVVQEGRGEHHVVSGIPELRVILLIESKVVS